MEIRGGLIGVHVWLSNTCVMQCLGREALLSPTLCPPSCPSLQSYLRRCGLEMASVISSASTGAVAWWKSSSDMAASGAWSRGSACLPLIKRCTRLVPGILGRAPWVTTQRNARVSSTMKTLHRGTGAMVPMCMRMVMRAGMRIRDARRRGAPEGVCLISACGWVPDRIFAQTVAVDWECSRHCTPLQLSPRITETGAPCVLCRQWESAGTGGP